MEIHGSSLNFSFLKLARQTAGKSDVAQNQPKHEPPASNKQQSRSGIAGQLPDRVEKIFEKKALPRLTTALAETTDHPLNTRTKNALNAYNRENRQELQDQRSESVSGIDLYV